MDEKLSNFLEKGLFIAIVVFILRVLLGFGIEILKCDTLYDFFGAAGEAVSLTTILLWLYNKFLWKINPFNKTPKYYGKYSGSIIFSKDGKNKNKHIDVTIEQTYLKINIKSITNEITSNSITSSIVDENNENVLYYIYITNPQSRVSMNNPIQYGTCRITQSEKGKLEGVYWTSRQTKGDIKLKKI